MFKLCVVLLLYWYLSIIELSQKCIYKCVVVWYCDDDDMRVTRGPTRPGCEVVTGPVNKPIPAGAGRTLSRFLLPHQPPGAREHNNLDWAHCRKVTYFITRDGIYTWIYQNNLSIYQFPDTETIIWLLCFQIGSCFFLEIIFSGEVSISPGTGTDQDAQRNWDMSHCGLAAVTPSDTTQCSALSITCWCDQPACHSQSSPLPSSPLLPSSATIFSCFSTCLIFVTKISKTSDTQSEFLLTIRILVKWYVWAVCTCVHFSDSLNLKSLCANSTLKPLHCLTICMKYNETVRLSLMCPSCTALPTLASKHYKNTPLLFTYKWQLIGLGYTLKW